MSVKFSIITPVYNRADCLEKCLKSVYIQKYHNYEHIVVNDGSIDETDNIITSLLDSFEKVKYIKYDNNKGVNYARNRGIENASGDYVIFLDSDDIFTDKALEIINNGIIENPNYLHYLYRISTNEQGGDSSTKEFTYFDWLSGSVSGDFTHVLKPSCFIDLMFFEEFRLYESLNWLRVMRSNKEQLYIPETVSLIDRSRNDSLTSESTLNSRSSMVTQYQVLQKYLQLYGDDLMSYGLCNLFYTKATKALQIGIAVGENGSNSIIMNTMRLNAMKSNLFYFNSKLFKFLFYSLIRIKSLYNRYNFKRWLVLK